MTIFYTGHLMIVKLMIPVLALVTLTLVPTDDTQPEKSASRLVTGLSQPGAVTAADNGTLYFASQQGGIRVVREGKEQPIGLEDKQIQNLLAWKNGLYACDHHELFHLSASG